MREEPTFQSCLDHWRKERKYSIRGLAAKAIVNHGSLSRILRGQRNCGMRTAVRLANALELDDYEKRVLMELAAQRHEIGAARPERLPRELEELLLRKLQALHVSPSDIANVYLDRSPDARLVLEDGRVVDINVELNEV